MLLKIVQMMSLLTVLLSVSSCSSVSMGDFCDLAFRLEVENRSSAEYLLANERTFVEDLNVHNRNVSECP